MRGGTMTIGALAGLFGAAGVALAAVGAHMSGSPGVTTAAHFLLFHAAALVGLAAVASRAPARGVLLAAATIALGTILFSGELALHALAGFGALAKAAPIGGTLMILGWLLAAVALPLALAGAGAR